MSNTLELLKKLEEFDTPTVTNVVATYPNRQSSCLGLYNPWAVNWYTDERVRCIYPELGPRAGLAVTCIYGPPDPRFNRLDFSHVLDQIRQSELPTILALEQAFPDAMRRKNGLLGGNMCTALKRSGCVGCVTNGPSRDIHEVRELGFQLLLTGVTAGHGDFAVQAVNVPVSVSGMDIAPGEIIHMDENGACKFDAKHLADVVRLCGELSDKERDQMAKMRNAEDASDLGNIMKQYGA